jgi:hypothetical protein
MLIEANITLTLIETNITLMLIEANITLMLIEANICDVGNPGPHLGQAQNCGGVKPVNGTTILPY